MSDDEQAESQEIRDAVEIAKKAAVEALEQSKSATEASKYSWDANKEIEANLQTVKTNSDQISKLLIDIKAQGDASKAASDQITAYLQSSKTNIDQINGLLTSAAANQKDLLSLLETIRKNSVELTQKAVAEAQAHSKTATESASYASSAKKEIESSLQSIKTSVDQINALATQAKTQQQELLSLLEKSRTSSAETVEIARIADEKNTRVDEYQKQLKELIAEFTATKEQIQKLLPAATGVGLAKSFNDRKKALEPTLKWSQRAFVVSILGFIGIGAWALLASEIKSVGDFLLFSFERSPIIVGLVLLEEFSRRLFNSTRKLEEDYAFKETISIAFDGYKKALSEVGDKATLANTFSNNVLEALKERPGRLLDSEKDEISAVDKLLEHAIPTGGEAKDKVLIRIYEDIRSSMKSKALRLVLIIALAIVVGIGLGYFYSHNIMQGRHAKATMEPIQDK